MKVYTYSEARQRFAEILNIARDEDVIIQRRGGEAFTITFKKTARSPFAITGIKTKATTTDILQAIKDSRELIAEPLYGLRLSRKNLSYRSERRKRYNPSKSQ